MSVVPLDLPDRLHDTMMCIIDPSLQSQRRGLITAEYSSRPSTRVRILNHALEALTTDDAPAFTMRAVAESLGLSSGSIFHAFPNRNALISAAFAEGISRYHDSAVVAITEHDDPVTSLQSFVEGHLRWVETNAGLARFLFLSQPHEIAIEASQLASQTNTRFAAAQSELFRALAGSGAMGDIDHRLAHSLAIGPSQEYCRKWLRGTATRSPSALIPVFQSGATAALAATIPASLPPAAPDVHEPAASDDEPAAPGSLTYQGVIYPWHCDHMGHMNVMWYTSKFDEATWHFFAGLGLTPSRQNLPDDVTLAAERAEADPRAHVGPQMSSEHPVDVHLVSNSTPPTERQRLT